MWHHLAGALADVAQLIVGVAVAGVVFVAESVGYNWNATDDQQLCENMDVMVGGAVTVVGVDAAWFHLLAY